MLLCAEHEISGAVTQARLFPGVAVLLPGHHRLGALCVQQRHPAQILRAR